MLIDTLNFAFFVPEAQRNLAGGGAKRNHRKPFRSSRPGRDAGQEMLVWRSCRSANLFHPTYLRLHRRLISVALPAR